MCELHEEHEPAIRDMLKRTYDVSGENELREQLETVAAQLADEQRLPRRVPFYSEARGLCVYSVISVTLLSRISPVMASIRYLYL